MSAAAREPSRPILLVGLGNRDCGDDAVGPLVADELAATAAGSVRVLERADPTDLVLDWQSADRVVVVDAVRSGAPVGTVVTTELAGSAGGYGAARSALGGTHAFGLDETVRLASALGRLPHRLTLVGVEAGSVAVGAQLSPEVAAALPAVVERVRRLVAAGESELERVAAPSPEVTSDVSR